jgi:hypothetical protein
MIQINAAARLKVMAAKADTKQAVAYIKSLLGVDVKPAPVSTENGNICFAFKDASKAPAAIKNVTKQLGVARSYRGTEGSKAVVVHQFNVAADQFVIISVYEDAATVRLYDQKHARAFQQELKKVAPKANGK